MLQPVDHVNRRIVLIGVIVTSTVILVTLISIRAYMLYKLSTDQAIIQNRFELLLEDEKSKNEALNSQINVLMETIYSMPSPPTTAVTTNVAPAIPRRESAIEAQMLKNDKLLSDRITVLEQWRLRVDKDFR